MLANVTCPACQHKFWLQEGEMGSPQTCPNCQSPFFAGASVAGAKAAAAAPASTAAAAPAAIQGGYAKTMIGESAPPIKYNCPRCKGPLEASASEAGTKKNCPTCTQRHQVPAPPKPEPVVAAATLNKTMLAGDEIAAPPRPPIKYNCPNPTCKKPLESPAEQAGTKRNCPSCNQRLQIPAAPAAPLNRNKTMLAGDESAAPASASPGVYSAGGAVVSSPVVVAPASAAGPWAALLTPKNVALAVVVLLLLLYLVPAFIRGGKDVDKEALAKAQMELEKLKADTEMKMKEMDRQAKAEAETRRTMDELMRNSRADEERRREEDRRKLREIADEDQRAAFKRKADQDQQEREKNRLEMERKNQQMLEETQRKLDETKRALESSQQKQTIIQQQPAPIITYPPYSPHYYRPWWW